MHNGFLHDGAKKLHLNAKLFGIFTGNDIENSSVPIRPGATKVPPAVAVGVGNDTTSNSSRDTRNFSQGHSSVASPLFLRHTLTCIRLFFILFSLL